MTRKATTWQDRLAWAAIAIAVAVLLAPRSFRIAASAPVGTVLLAPLRLVALTAGALSERRQENGRLAILAAELAVENARLQAQAGATTPVPAESLPLVRAPVIARDLATFDRYFVVSRGTQHGVRPGSPAITPDGVAGKVVSAGPHQSLIQTLLANESRVAVMALRSRVPGVARPTGAGTLLVDYLPEDADYQAGDTVVTAGLGEVYPKGLRVGVVIRSEPKPGALFRPVFVRPFVNFSRVEAVFVVSLPETLPQMIDSASSGAGWRENVGPAEVAVPEESPGH